MNDEKMMTGLRTVVIGFNVLLMFITIIMQIFAFNVLQYAIMSSCILLLITVTLVFDGILKDKKEMTTHVFWYALWFFLMIMNLFKL